MVSGPQGYQLSFYYRLLAGAFEFVILANYVIYHFYPMDTPLPTLFRWPWIVSFILAIIIGVPAIILMFIEMSDAGEKTLRPKKEHSIYGGIYNKIRHPQATSEIFLFLVIVLLLQSPFLRRFSLIYFPIFIIICFAEEQNLLPRYGEAYAVYYQHTGVFWPTRWR